jgi:adenylate cyclase class 2
MPVEIEAKMRVPDHEPVRQSMRAAGATFVSRTVETNRFYDAPDRRLGAADNGLRLRTNTDADTGVATHVVTFKGPRQAGKFKTREELEFTTDDVDATAAIFERLGYPAELTFAKRRETWELDGCKVELDELPVLGTFVEVEGKDEASVEAVRVKLALQGEPSLSKGYASMVAEHLAKTGGRELTFG